MIGVWEMYSGGTSVSRTSHTRTSDSWIELYCFGPTLTAAAVKMVFTFFSPKVPTNFRSNPSNPGICWREVSAARSVGCSHARGLMSLRMTRPDGCRSSLLFFAAMFAVSYRCGPRMLRAIR